MQRDFNSRRGAGDPDGLRAEIEARATTRVVSYLLFLFWMVIGTPAVVVLMIVQAVGIYGWGILILTWRILKLFVETPAAAMHTAVFGYQKDMAVYVNAQIVRHLK